MNILAKIMGLFIGIILAATLLVPVVDDAIKTNQDEFKNVPTGQSFYFMDSDDELTIDFDGIKAPVLNGALFESKDLTCFAASNMFIQYFSNNHSCRVGYWDGSAVQQINGAESIELTITNYTANGTVTKSGVTTTLTDVDLGDWCGYGNSDGNYVILSTVGSQSFYVNNIDQMYGVCDTSVSTTKLISFNGSEAIENGTVVEPTYTITAVSGYVDVYQLSTSGYTVDSLTPLTWIAPKVIYGTEPTNESINSLLSIVPLFIIVSLVVAAIGMIAIKRD